MMIKHFWRSCAIGLAVYAIMLLVALAEGKVVGMQDVLGVRFLFCMLYSSCLYACNATVFWGLDVFCGKKPTVRKTILGFLMGMVGSSLVIFLLRIFEELLLYKNTWQAFLAAERWSNYVFSLAITMLITAFIHAFHYYKNYQERRVKEQKILAGNASAQFESLKNQLDPHFLFNSLNVLSALIEENQVLAQKFTTSLSKIYRYVLEQRDKELVSVQEELDFAMTYMNLLRMRFENSIVFEMPEGYDNTEAKVVPLSLQLLLENTIKHNVVSEQRPLRIRIAIMDNWMVVSNNLQKKEVMHERSGVGLQNIVSRYAILTQRPVLIEQTASDFTVQLPILTKQLEIMETNYVSQEQTAYWRAAERVKQLKGFYGNLISYCCVIPLLIFINYQSTRFQWFWFPMMGWGLGVTLHAVEVFGYGKNWEARKIQQIINKQSKQQKQWK